MKLPDWANKPKPHSTAKCECKRKAIAEYTCTIAPSDMSRNKRGSGTAQVKIRVCEQCLRLEEKMRLGR